MIFLTLKPYGCGCKISSMRFYNRTIVLYRTNVHVSHSILQNHFRRNFSKRGSRGEHRQSRDWANKQQWTSQIKNNQGNQHIKTASISSKIRGNPSLNSVHQYTHQPIIHPSSHPPWGAHLGRANAPAEAPGPGRSEEYTILCENYMHIKRSKMYRIILKHKIAKELENNA